MQYFLTASFAWMFVEVVDMYLLFVKVWSNVQSYVEKMAVIGWGFPFLLTIATLSAHIILKNNSASTEEFDWKIYPEFESLTTK